MEPTEKYTERESAQHLEERHRERSLLASAGKPVQGQRGLEGLS